MDSEEVTIAGQVFTLTSPYAEGHVLTRGEASQLNQVRHENIRNNFAKRVKDAVEAGTFDLAQFQATLSEYESTYTMGVRTPGTGRQTADPVKREALALAKAAVVAALKRAGKSTKSYTKDQIAEAAAKALDKHPEWMDAARQRVEEKKNLASESLDELDLGEPQAQAEAA